MRQCAVYAWPLQIAGRDPGATAGRKEGSLGMNGWYETVQVNTLY